jgi:hypothetical protein
MRAKYASEIAVEPLDASITQRVKEQRTSQTMLEATSGMAGLVLEIQLDAGKTRQRQGDQVGVGAALEVRLDDADGFAGPLSGVAHGLGSH